jgi:hypothetical protein
MPQHQDLEKMTDEELEAIAKGSAAAPADDLEALSDEELEQIANGPSLGDQLKGFGKRMLTGAFQPLADIVTTPLEAMDKVTGAPLRAGMGALQGGKGFGGAADAALEQLAAGAPSMNPITKQVGSGELLPSTPTGKDIALKGMLGQGIAEPYAESMAPMVGAGAEVALDATNLIPGKLATGAAKGLKSGAIGAAKLGGKALDATASGVSKLAPKFTRVLKAEKAMQMYRDLNSWEMLFPGTRETGRAAEAMKVVGEAREAFRSQPVGVPGSHEAMERVAAAVKQGAYRAGKTEGSIAVLDMIEQRAFETVEITEDLPISRAELLPAIEQAKAELSMAQEEAARLASQGQGIDASLQQQLTSAAAEIHAMEQLAADGKLTRRQTRVERRPKDLTLDELDDIYRKYNSMQYTPLGNERQLDPVWAPFVNDARAITDEIMQSIPEGQAFKAKKQRAESLMIAGRERSQLVELGADLEGIHAVKDLASGNIIKAGISAMAQMVTPKGFVTVLAATKAPKDIARRLQAAYDSRSMVAVRNELSQLAESHPYLAERFARSVVLITGKPAAQQFITPEEAETLGARRIFDPMQVAAERRRLIDDRAMPSTERARALSKINRDGYVTMPGKEPPPPAAEPLLPEPEQQPDMGSMLKALKTSAGTKIPAEEFRSPKLDPMGQPIPWGIEAKDSFMGALGDGIVSPMAEKGYPDLGAARATVPGVLGDLLIPTQSGDLAAMPPGWKVIKGGGETLPKVEPAARKALRKKLEDLWHQAMSAKDFGKTELYEKLSKEMEPIKAKLDEDYLDYLEPHARAAETRARVKPVDGLGEKLRELETTGTKTKLQDHKNWVDEPTNAFERVMSYIDEPKAKKIRQYVTKVADGSEPYFGYAIENPAWVEKKGQMSSLPQPMPVDFKSIDPKGHLGKGVATGKADPFSWMESRYGVSKKVLEEHANKPLKISTRSDLIAHEDYLELLNPNLHEVEFHVFSDNARANRAALPGAPSVKRIMTAVERLQERGIKVTLVHDVVKGVPDELNAMRPFILKQETGIKKVPPIRENVIEPEGDGIFKTLGIDPED